MDAVLTPGAAHLVGHLADNDFGDTLGDGVAGPVGLLIIVLMAVATVLLIRNMNKRLRRLPESFPDPYAPKSDTEPRSDATTKSDAKSEPPE